MAERELIVDHLRVEYEGLFDATELYRLIDLFFRDKGYDKRDLKNIEKVRPEGKYVEIELMPWKKTTDYFKNEIKIRIIMQNLKEVEVEKDGRKIRLNQGKLNIVFDGYFTTDYEHRWEQKPSYFFIRTLFDKFFFSSYTDKYKGVLVHDTNTLITDIKTFLNLYRY